ncbi:ABC transporter substrate-binding protein [Actinomadura madurae]|uniref:ABC transporter substrate-binding protein n=2 Tax=Actinomadura madurae TaxID=1993 RepID=UPI0020D227FC|nr:ABC transporter substrate-binding protein [Actinomadura madurae]MCP9968096.1 ABC transporter substrate-binding protein [Actinomadura madurae]MCP9980556.1 ABC transporter substrate-binding protein [Actinomadura madurae]MCQ0007926.1 ABC transporter substrate-binding protein [Actinomadura madurae]
MSIHPRRGAGIAAVTAALMVITACGGVKDASQNRDATAGLADAELVAPFAGMECKEGTKPTGKPIVVGASLSLTGALAPTGLVHEQVGEIVAEWVGECGGIDGRPIQWKVLDDQSTPAQVTSNYSRLIGDKVDLVMGPYGGAATLAGAGPVTKAGYAYPTATNGAPDKLIGENHFPSWQIGGGVSDPSQMFDAQAKTLVEALKSSGNAPKSMFLATAKFPTTLSYTAAIEKAFKAAGVKIAGSVQYDMGTTDFSSIATRISSQQPDLVYLGSLGADVTNIYQAFDTIGYKPKTVYAALPSPASIAGLGDKAEGMLLSSIYENHAPLGDTDIARYFAKSFSEAAKAKKLFPLVETQAAAGFAAWQILLTAVGEVGVDNKKIIAWLNGNKVDTIVGRLSFDGYNNYGADLNRVTQIQDGRRVLVWPKDIAGAEIRYEP